MLLRIIIIIIIKVFSLIAILDRNKVDPRRANKASSIQHIYRKSGNQARVHVYPNACAWEQQQ